ncbi:hypothetical protein P7K49_038669 [Saguinus oedipus]|uniref:Ig-like domain-containing protein n=1 Tax=Saguinus oedipus TaxID=9490 RepID=A0ABQ9TFB4_SAGOE|nr:hypothetical protein P7K49_038669 [Saguinus oedipus]
MLPGHSLAPPEDKRDTVTLECLVAGLPSWGLGCLSKDCPVLATHPRLPHMHTHKAPHSGSQHPFGEEAARQMETSALVITLSRTHPRRQGGRGLLRRWRNVSLLSFEEGKQKSLALHSGLTLSWVLTLLGSPTFWHCFRPGCHRKAGLKKSSPLLLPLLNHHCDDSVPLAGAPELPPGLEAAINCQINLELYASYVYRQVDIR